MYFSMHFLATDCWLAPARERRTSHAELSAAVTRIEPDPGPEPATGEHTGARSDSNRIYRRLGAHAEHSLFALTLAAIGYLEALALLAAAV